MVKVFELQTSVIYLNTFKTYDKKKQFAVSSGKNRLTL